MWNSLSQALLNTPGPSLLVQSRTARPRESMTSAGDSRTDVIIVAVVLLTILSTLSFIGRIWGRLLSAVKLGWDDLLMTVALVRKLQPCLPMVSALDSK